jgi:TolB-like protein/DNA-binding SARP family transcriptional activator
MVFSLRTFGCLRLVNAGGDVPFPDKGLMALCYLFDTKQHEASRADIATLLWSGENHAGLLANMRKTISRIKSRQSELGVEFLTFTPTTIKVEAGALNWDQLSLELAAGDDPARSLHDLTDIMQAEFWDGFEPVGTMLDVWVEQKRKDFSDQLLHAFKAALATIPAERSDASTRKAALLAFKRHPQDEDIQRFLLDSDGDHGPSAAALVPPSSNAAQTPGRQADAGLPLALASRMLNKQFAQARATLLARPVPFTSPYGGNALNVPRLALLPPENASESIVATLLAATLIEDITIGFSALQSVRVIAPHTSRQFSRDPDKAATFERHAISYILETRISYEQEVSLFAQLVSFANDEIVWAERFSLDASQLTRQRREISTRIALTVASHIERDGLSRAYFEESPDAYHSYLVGQRHLKELTLPNLRRARREFRTALQKNPRFAPALSGIARTYSKEWLLTARGDQQLLACAAEFSGKAIAAGEDLSGGYRELGVVRLLQGDIDESVDALQLAEKLSPNYADIIADLADTLVHFSQPAEALKKIAKAIDLNPLAPDTYLWTAAGASYCLGQFETALSYIAMMRDGALADRLSAASWAMLGDNKKARVFVRSARQSNPDFDVDKWLSVIAMKDQWQKDLYREGLRKAGF